MPMELRVATGLINQTLHRTQTSLAHVRDASLQMQANLCITCESRSCRILQFEVSAF
jgi:hypothetical protein